MFRLAFGDCSCNNPNRKQGSEIQKLCDFIKPMIEELKRLPIEQLQSLPNEENELSWLEGKRVIFTTINEPIENANLIVVRAFMFSWKWPTLISLHYIGHVVAEGIIVSNNGRIKDAPNDYLWPFR